MIKFGQDSYGNTVSLDPHRYSTLIVGQTRSGKSATAYACLSQIAKDCTIVVTGIDVSGLLLAPFEDCGQSLVITDDSNPVLFDELLSKIVDVMEKRSKWLRTNGKDKLTPSIENPTIIVVLEEFTSMLASCDAYDAMQKPQDRVKPKVLNKIGRLLRSAAKINIHIWIMMQRAETAIFSGELRSNIPRKIGHKSNDADSVKMIAEQVTKEQIERILTFRPGVGFMVEPGNEIVFFKSAFMEYEEYLRRIAADYQPRNNLWLQSNSK